MEEQPEIRYVVWRARRDSNPRPADPKSAALSTELRAHNYALTERMTRPALCHRALSTPDLDTPPAARDLAPVDPERLPAGYSHRSAEVARGWSCGSVSSGMGRLSHSAREHMAMAAA